MIIRVKFIKASITLAEKPANETIINTLDNIFEFKMLTRLGVSNVRPTGWIRSL